MRSNTRRAAIGALALGFSLGSIPVALGGNTLSGELAGYAASKLDRPISFNASASDIRTGLHQSLRQAEGLQTVIVRLKAQPMANPGAKGTQAAHQRAMRRDQQAQFIQRIAQRAPGMKVLAQTQLVLNAVFLEVDAAALPAMAADKDVVRIAPVADYQLDLPETVPYIGATAVQKAGFDGSGVSIAILDSGIDYTHAHLGGPGTLAAYEAAYGTDTTDPRNTTRDGLFPTAKVVEGFDFVGEVWPDGPLVPDDDPIDFGAHGTNVADISGGLGGVAPGTDLYAVKVCSAISSSCSGIALIQGMEYAVDPNGDDLTDDHVDIINMSLGSGYGQPFDDDLSAAVDNATAIGVLTVASAGNGSDKPYITGTPSAALTALSVAQTQVPSAALQLLTLGGDDYTAVFQAWAAPLTSAVSAPIQYADGAGGNLTGCDPFAAGSLAGKIVLVDRGGCFFTTKIFNVGNAGGLVGIIGLVAPGAPFSGGFADPGGPITIPGFMISQSDADAVRAAIDGGNDTGVVDPDNILPLVQSMVGSSSRGPRNQDNLLKPEIGAPGASVSALAGTGDGTRVFGGTSGAAPMVAGSAALLIDAFRGDIRGVGSELPPAVIKALLMNTGETDIETDPFTGLAPISRIGGGEVRVDRALNASAVAWDDETLQGGLSFGFVDVDDTTELTRTVNVLGLGDESRAPWTITPGFRFDDDAASGAISVAVPASVDVTPGALSSFEITLTIDGSKLPGNYMNSGSNGANPATLTINEYDGYLTLSNGAESIHLPWHVLPRKAARVQSAPPVLPGGPFGGGPANRGLKLKNRGVGTAQVDGYTLLATSPDIPSGGAGEQSPTPDLRAVGYKTIPVSAGFCSDDESFLLVFAANTWERQTYLLPVSHQFSLDIGQDGTFEYIVLNRDLSFTGVSDGRQATFVFDTATEDTTAFFFAEHATNTGNTALTICAEQIGMTTADLGVPVGLEVFAQDFYFGGPGDTIDGLSMTPGGERLNVVSTDIPAQSTVRVEVIDNGSGDGIGLLLFTNGDRGTGARGGATQETEALIINTAGSGGRR